MLWNLSQRTFNGGQLDGRLMGRTDLTKYFQGASVLQNFIVKRQGCISRRPGTRILHTINDFNFSRATHFRMIPFSYDLDGGFVITMYAMDNAVATCLICDSSGSTVATLTVPYKGRAIEEIEYCQSGDTLFLAHRGYPFAHIIRKEVDGAATWTYRAVDFATLDHLSIPNQPVINKITSAGFSGTGPSVTVEYCATAVKGDVESKPSARVSKSYKTPWMEGATITLSIKPDPAENVDAYYIYKRRNGRSWGFVGTADNGPTKWYDTPVKAFTTRPNGEGYSTEGDSVLKFGNNTPQPLDTTIFHTAKIDNCSTAADNFGRVIESGSTFVGWCEAEGGAPRPITSIHVGLGYAMRWALPSGGSTILGQFIPCKVKKVRAIFHCDDDTEETIDVNVPTSVWDESIAVSGTSASTVNTNLKNASPDVWLDFDLYTPGEQKPIKKVCYIELDAYADDECTELATGRLVMPETPGADYATLEGSPFVIRGVYCTTLTVNTRDAIQFVDDYIEPDQSVSPPKYEPFFNSKGKYPGCVTLYQQRLVLASTDEQPFTFWMSCVGDLYNFNTHDSLREDDALEVTLPALKYPDINHMAVNRDLILFCDNGEWMVSPIAGNAMTYATISTKVESQIGGSKLHQPIVVGNDVLFVNAADETLIATKYDFTSDSYGTQDLSVLSHDIFRNNPITSIAYQKNPDSLIIATLRDGSFATLTYMKEHEVVAWSIHRLANGTKALAVCTDGSMVDGATNAFLLDDHGHILRFTPVPEIATDPRQLAAIDCSTEIASGTTVPTGQIAVSPAGQVVGPGETAPAGSIVGIPFESKLVTVRPEPSPQETVQFEVKNPTHADVRTHSASTFRIGQLGMPRDRDRTVKIAPPSQSNGKWTAPDADGSANIAGANGRDGRMILTCDGPWPLTVLSLFTAYQVEKADQNPGRGE